MVSNNLINLCKDCEELKQKRIVIDIDGTICTFKEEGQTYSDVIPLPGSVETIEELRKNGYYIILYTARHQKTCKGNEGKILARVGKKTIQWLEDNKIYYDEIHFTKPYADIYLDDKAMLFENWDKVKEELL